LIENIASLVNEPQINNSEYKSDQSGNESYNDEVNLINNMKRIPKNESEQTDEDLSEHYYNPNMDIRDRINNKGMTMSVQVNNDNIQQFEAHEPESITSSS